MKRTLEFRPGRLIGRRSSSSPALRLCPSWAYWGRASRSSNWWSLSWRQPQDDRTPRFNADNRVNAPVSVAAETLGHHRRARVNRLAGKQDAGERRERNDKREDAAPQHNGNPL